MVRLAQFGMLLGAAAMLAMPVTADAQRKQSRSSAASAQDDTLAKMIAERKAAAEATAPWHFKTDQQAQFRRPNPSLAFVSSEKHATNDMGWVSISPRMTNKAGSYPDFELLIGLSEKGEIEGVLYGDFFSTLRGAEAALAQVDEIETLMLVMDDGDGVEISLGLPEEASWPNPKAEDGMTEVYFRRFKLPRQGYRMLKALPDETPLGLRYTTADGTEGKFSNRGVSQFHSDHMFTVGYAKEMIRLIREANGTG